jgi:hypothetical protein
MTGRREARGILALWLLPELIIKTNLEDHLVLVHVLFERELGQHDGQEGGERNAGRGHHNEPGNKNLLQ